MHRHMASQIKPLKSIHQPFYAKDLSILPKINSQSVSKKDRRSSALIAKEEHFSTHSLVSNTKSIQEDFARRSSVPEDSVSSLDNLPVLSQPRIQLTYLLPLDLVQSPAERIYPNVRLIRSGFPVEQNEQNIIYTFTNTFTTTVRIPLVFLGNRSLSIHIELCSNELGSEYFLRYKMPFERLRYPIGRGELLEPLIDLFLHRPQFTREIPQLVDLSNYLLLPRTISAHLFFDSSSRPSARHLCQEWRSKENRNKFTINDLRQMSQRENHLIQSNVLNDRRYQNLREALHEIYTYQSSILLKGTRLTLAQSSLQKLR